MPPRTGGGKQDPPPALVSNLEGNLPQLNAVAAAVVCLLEVVDGPVGERNARGEAASSGLCARTREILKPDHRFI